MIESVTTRHCPYHQNEDGRYERTLILDFEKWFYHCEACGIHGAIGGAYQEKDNSWVYFLHPCDQCDDENEVPAAEPASDDYVFDGNKTRH